MTTISRISHPVSIVPVMLALALALSACGTAGKGVSGAGLGLLGGGSSAQKPETNLLAPLGNGLLGSSAGQLGANDRKRRWKRNIVRSNILRQASRSRGAAADRTPAM